MKVVTSYARKVLLPSTAALTLFAGAAQAEVSSSASIASMYLWRGVNVSGGPAVSGDITYSHSSGAYASYWMSSEGVTAPFEVDTTIGFAGEAAGVSYDLGYYKFWYPYMDSDEAEAGLQGQSFGDAGDETYVSVGYGPVAAKVYIGDGYNYVTLSGSMGAFGLTYGMNMADKVTDPVTSEETTPNWSHIDVSYAATDSLSFIISKPMDDGAGVAEEPLFLLTYSVPLK